MNQRTHVTIAGAFCFALSGLMGACATGSRPDASGPELRRVLVFSKTSWYRHDAIPVINDYFVELGREHGFDVETTEDPTAFTSENLERFQVVLFNNTTDIGKSLDESQRAAFERWFASGGGLVGIHAAAVHHKTWPWYEATLGTDFNSDVERQTGRLRVDAEAGDHPAVRHLPAEWTVAEEWMNYETNVRGTTGTTVLLTLDESSIDTTVKRYFQDKGGRPMGQDHPVAWTRTVGGGRVFYTNFGHSEDALQLEAVRKHLLGGLKWAAGGKRRSDLVTE